MALYKFKYYYYYGTDFIQAWSFAINSIQTLVTVTNTTHITHMTQPVLQTTEDWPLEVCDPHRHLFPSNPNRPLLTTSMLYVYCMLCLLMHSAVVGTAPDYLKNMLHPVSEHASQRALRSATNNDMVVPRSRLKFGERTFSIAAPRAWNSIPADLRATLNTATFKKKLKTFLFRESYSMFWLNSFVTSALLHCPFLILVYCIFCDLAGRPLL